MTDKHINIHTGEVIERNYDAALAMGIGEAAYVPAVGMVTMTRAAFEYLMVRSGALPEPWQSPNKQPLSDALRGEV